MHELSIITSILDIVLKHAAMHNARSIRTINLAVGDLSDFVPEWMQRYFDYASKETIAESAKLVIEHIPVEFTCRQCATVTRLTKGDWQFSCPSCSSSDIEITRGREFQIMSIEIE